MGENLERIFAEGTMRFPQIHGGDLETFALELSLLPTNLIECHDGFRVSVVAGFGTYCLPRPGWTRLPTGDTVPYAYTGPYTHVEVGFPSDRPEPWVLWRELADEPRQDYDTVFGFVPANMVRELVELHGGEVERRIGSTEGAANGA